MKYLPLLLLLTACCPNGRSDKEPLFMYHQKVTYAIPHYYQKVCTGKGYVTRFGRETNGLIWYDVENDDSYCPSQIVYEGQLKSNE